MDKKISPKMDKRLAINQLWRHGNLRYKLDANQREIYDFVEATKEPIVVIGSSRQIGKTYFLVAYAISYCLRHPNVTVKFVSPTVKMTRTNIGPIFRELTLDAPKDVLPTYSRHDNAYRFKNGSEIQLAGTDNGNVESIRGGKAHLCILDEAAFMDDLEYAINSVLLPTTTTTGGKIVMASTPPKSPDHPFTGFMQRAESNGALIKRTIYDNPRMTEDRIKALAATAGGFDSVDFRREYLVENIISEDDAVVPEFTKELEAKIVKEVTRPPLADTYVSMDIGGADLTVVIFGFYDFMTSKVVIEDELVFNRKVLSDEIAEAIKQKEQQLWADSTGYVKPPYLRIADNNNIILVNDLGIKHGLYFFPTLKDNKIAELNNMRILLKQERILINPRCKTLISHLKSAVWNKARTQYARSADKGHYDMCFIPGNRVLTRDGYKNIEDIQVGEEVLTHNNRFRKVTNVMSREYSGNVIKVSTDGNPDILCTPEHNFMVRSLDSKLTWIPIKDITTEELYNPDNESFVSPIIDKSYGYEGIVHNLEVEEDNSYVVNGAAVHNCDALVYMTRNINLTRNPYPSNYAFSGQDHIVIKDTTTMSNFESQLVNRIKRNNPFRRR